MDSVAKLNTVLQMLFLIRFSATIYLFFPTSGVLSLLPSASLPSKIRDQENEQLLVLPL
jgi:hypothetical protein